MRSLRRNSTLGIVATGVLGATLSTACLDSKPDAPHGALSTGRREGAAQRPIERSPPLPRGAYDVQSVSYDDATGVYQMFLLGTPPGTPAAYRSNDLRMARIEDSALASGKKSYLEVNDSAPTLYLTPDFSIAYVHNVTEEQVNPRTGEPELVVLRQETSTWSPFMSAMAGAAVGNMLFAPRYYYPPPYSPGSMAGYGSVGMTRSLASEQYTQRFGREPQAARVSKTGIAPRRTDTGSLRPTGRGAGASTFSRGNSWKPSKPTRSFGFGRRR